MIEEQDGFTLPHGTYLAYTVANEEYTWSRTAEPSILISAMEPDGAVAWEFRVMERGPGVLRVELNSDAWDAFADAPRFFADLGSLPITTLGEVRGLLDSYGAVDQTERVRPASLGFFTTVVVSTDGSVL